MARTKGCAYLRLVPSLLDLPHYAIIGLPCFLLAFDAVYTIQSPVEVDRLPLPFSFHVSLEQRQVDQLFLGVPGRAIRELASGLLIDSPFPLLRRELVKDSDLLPVGRFVFLAA